MLIVVCIPCSVRSFEDVLVKIHDQIDSAGDLHVEVALQQEAVVWHDILIFLVATSVVHIAPMYVFPRVAWGSSSCSARCRPIKHEYDGVSCAVVLTYDTAGLLHFWAWEEPQH